VVRCTLADCSRDNCNESESLYMQAHEAARRCDPSLAREQCTWLATIALHCPDCGAFLNPANGEAMMDLARWQDVFDRTQCQEGYICGPDAGSCPPARGYCSAEGRCEVTVDAGGASCLVNGIIYEHGRTDIKDPVSCNTCQCNDGSLACTKIACETPCPPDSIAARRCVQCGSSGGCSLMETGCFPVCNGSCSRPGETCDSGYCALSCD
jgi:hypothetical protein